MKKLSVMLLIVISGSASFAQDITQKDVPAIVLNAFQQKFPKQTVVEWEMKNGLYEAEFEITKNEHNVYIDSTGKIVRYKQEIAANELPAAVTSSIQKNFKDYKIKEAKKIEKGSAITYKVELENSKEERDVVFSADGKIEENKID